MVLALALVVACASAYAVSNGDGDLIVTFDGAITPKALPRGVAVPVAVRVAGNVKSASGESGSLPQLRRISVAINRQGQLFDRGLPVCREVEIRSSTPAGARDSCGDALVGSGHLTVQVRIRDQLPFSVGAKLLAFNGPRRGGRKLILGHAYAPEPPGSFVLRFRVRKRTGTYGTVLTTSLPRGTLAWAYITHFDLTLDRTYRYHGRRRAYVSAACAAPAGFDRALFPFARARYEFTGGKRLTLAQAAVCRVAGQ